ncbi:MAG: MATE family efflux transporter [Sphaerochaetaceae bacterium]|nr:MATE family efflux transporter [Sphaerochaetaceae bacterium]
MKVEKGFYKHVALLTFPIVIQNVLDSAVNMADVIMLNYVGQSSISAVSLATQITSLFFWFLFGTGTGMTMMGSQYWGKGNTDAINRSLGIAIKYTLFISGFSAFLCLVFPTLLMRIYTPDQQLIELGSVYLRLFAPGIIAWGISYTFLAGLRSTGRVAICTMTETITLILNVLLNALFIFVLDMGAAGVAVATAIARIIEMIICIFISLRSSDIKIRIKYIFKSNSVLDKDFRGMCFPAIANDFVWGLAFSMFSVILGHRSSDAVAANAIVTVVRNLGCVFSYGIAGSTGIILGQMLGAGKQQEAIVASRILLILAVLAGAFGGFIIFCLTPFISSGANLTETAHEYLLFMLHVNCFYIMGTSINTPLIAGTFRAGGNSRFGLLVDGITMWCWAVPAGFIAAFALKLDIKIVYLVLCTDEFVKLPTVFKYFFSNKWAKNITRENSELEYIEQKEK